MLRPRIWIAGALCCLACAAGCGFTPRPVDVTADPASLERLSGRWQGEYTIPEGRHGLIDFRLSAGNKQAFGDVLMFAEDHREPYRAFQQGSSPGDDRSAKPQAQLLTIRFVRAEDGRLSGSLAPYWDPDRGCQALAKFDGVSGDGVMHGTFTSTCEDGVRQLRGTWRVQRRPSR